MSQLRAAAGSRSNGSSNGFGTLSGSIPRGDMRTAAQINDTQQLIKQMQRAASRSDWATYNQLQTQLKFQ